MKPRRRWILEFPVEMTAVCSTIEMYLKGIPNVDFIREIGQVKVFACFMCVWSVYLYMCSCMSLSPFKKKNSVTFEIHPMANGNTHEKVNVKKMGWTKNLENFCIIYSLASLASWTFFFKLIFTPDPMRMLSCCYFSINFF